MKFDEHTHHYLKYDNTGYSWLTLEVYDLS